MNHAKIIKIISILALIIGIIGLIIGIVTFVGGGIMAVATSDEQIMSEVANDPSMASALNEIGAATGTDASVESVAVTVSAIIIVAAVMLIISSVFAILEGAFGLRAAKGKGASAALVIGIISLATAIVRLITAAVSGGGASGILGAIPAIIIAGIYVYCAKALRDNKGKMI